MVVLATILFVVGAILGPVKADVVRVVDGDTIKVNAHVWNDIRVMTSVRVLGVDTPELRGKCFKEKEMAVAAKQFVIDTISNEPIYLRNIKTDKFGGRVLAEVYLGNGHSLSEMLIQSKHGREYNGGKRKGWCGK